MAVTPPQPNHHQEEERGTKKKLAPLNWVWLVVILALIAGVGIYFWKRPPRNQTAQNDDTLEQIREAFQPTPTPGLTPTFVPPFPGDEAPTPTPTTPFPTGVSPRNPTPSPPSTSSGPTAGPRIYNFPQHGFDLTLPAGFIADGNLGNKVLIFNSSTGQQTGYVEIYSNSSNETLNSLSAYLQGSPDIHTVRQTNVGGVAAVEFLSNSSEKSGIATIYNNNIYYFRGNAASSNIASKVKFGSAGLSFTVALMSSYRL